MKENGIEGDCFIYPRLSISNPPSCGRRRDVVIHESIIDLRSNAEPLVRVVVPVGHGILDAWVR